MYSICLNQLYRYTGGRILEAGGCQNISFGNIRRLHKRRLIDGRMDEDSAHDEDFYLADLLSVKIKILSNKKVK